METGHVKAVLERAEDLLEIPRPVVARNNGVRQAQFLSQELLERQLAPMVLRQVVCPRTGLGDVG